MARTGPVLDRGAFWNGVASESSRGRDRLSVERWVPNEGAPRVAVFRVLRQITIPTGNPVYFCPVLQFTWASGKSGQRCVPPTFWAVQYICVSNLIGHGHILDSCTDAHLGRLGAFDGRELGFKIETSAGPMVDGWKEKPRQTDQRRGRVRSFSDTAPGVVLPGPGGPISRCPVGTITGFKRPNSGREVSTLHWVLAAKPASRGRVVKRRAG